MTAPISLDALVNCLQTLNTGEAICVDAGEIRIVPSDTRSHRAEKLTGLSEEEEAGLAREFCETVEDGADRMRLMIALSGESPRERFEAAVYRCRIANAWFSFRDRRLLRLAREWLEARGLGYVDDVPADGR